MCCEALTGTVECKASWDRERIKEHFDRFVVVKSKRHENFSSPNNAAGYFVVVFDPIGLDEAVLADFRDDGRVVGIYSVRGDRSWFSPAGAQDFSKRQGNGLALLLKDLLLDCMVKGSKDEGTFTVAHDVVRAYVE